MPKISFDPLRPDEAIKYIKSKKLGITYDYDEMMFEAHNKAFTVAKIMRTDLLKDMHDAVAASIEDGTSFETFQKNIKPTLQKKGWWGTQEILNPKTGEVKEIHIGSRRLKNILHTNKRVAQAKGRWKQQSGFTISVYLRYVAKQYGNRREKHQSAHGTLKHKDDSWWDVNYPTNGYGCDCTTVTYSKKQLEKRGFKVQEGKSPNIADKGWRHHSGKSNKVDDIYKQKVASLSYLSLAKVAAQEFKKDENTLLQRVATYKAVKELFTDKPKNKVVELCESDMFGKNKPLYLSHPTVQEHLHRNDIGAFHYSLIPQMLEGKNIKLKVNNKKFLFISYRGSVYRLVVKNVKDKHEIYVVSLVRLGSNVDKEIKKLKKKYE
ncbi:phage minor head protein [Sulfurimonas sp.]|uniref:phage head morphogenesis protein n=1 Tax=Sulfurimonas sp. TaxID=2022749 RepID=UPI002B49B9ED|nr:phage minor head protein [Sulfurimonas sp.]